VSYQRSQSHTLWNNFPINNFFDFRRLFTWNGRESDAFPPTRSALHQHCLRAGYQDGQMWNRYLEVNPKQPNPEGGGGGIRTRKYHLLRVSLDHVPSKKQALAALVKCGCKLSCSRSRNCRCRKVDLPCTEFCECGGDCLGDVQRVSSYTSSSYHKFWVGRNQETCKLYSSEYRQHLSPTYFFKWEKSENMHVRGGGRLLFTEEREGMGKSPTPGY